MYRKGVCLKMKRILITGANSYIGTSFENWMNKYDGYKIDTVDMIGDAWREYDFSKYDTVLHVAGIAHIKETKENAPMYYKVNRDLTVETAIRAKESGVKQFILLSSMSVFGLTTGVITKDTVPSPKTNYGKSKLEADIQIAKLSGSSFKTAIIRPPMVYGEGCKGNYQILKKAALKLPLFPDIENRRSMIHINTLCEYIKKLIDSCSDGYFYPQDKEYVCTTNMVKDIAVKNGHSITFIKWFNPIIKTFDRGLLGKIFGDLIYKDMD